MSRRKKRNTKDFSVGSRGSGPPLAGLRFALVGAGHVGGSMARWLLARGAGLDTVTRRSGSLPPWAATSGAVLVSPRQLASGSSDLLLLAVPEADLAEVAAALASRPQAPVALHTAGSRGAEVLAPLRQGGSAIGALHPLRAFPRQLPSLAIARRTFFALDGDAKALDLATRLARALGAPSAVVPAAARPLYHLAATLAAGGSVTLLGAAGDLQVAAGVDRGAAAGLAQLAAGAIAAAAAATASPITSLTGPVQRGELGYLRQLEELRARLPELHPLAVLLALEGLRQLAHQGLLGSAQAALLKELRALCRGADFLDPLFRGVLSSKIQSD